MENNNRNTKQDIMIMENRKDICWLKKAVQRIERQVFNEIPHQISEFKDKITLYFVIGIVTVIIVQLFLRFFL
ncbi:MAG: hypothetical protein QMC93_03655 [Patescibacteria group bacterium]|nr:hypothetical protein [Patescibacteria group bacterium]